MQYTPHNYQAYCIQRVVEDPAIGLFLRPGLGKTVITLSAVNILKYFRWQVAKALVVAPKKVAEATWSKEAAKWDHLQHLRVSTVLGSASKRIKALNLAADSNVTVVEFNRVQRVRNCVPIDAEQCIFKAAVTGAVVNGLSVINEFYRRVSVCKY